MQPSTTGNCATPETASAARPSLSDPSPPSSPDDQNGSNGGVRFTGTLLKYTNVMKGWQTRLVIVDSSCKRIIYYAYDEIKKPFDRGQVTPRATVDITNATVVPSEEDSVSFSISVASGEVIKFRANDARDRQHWVDRIRQAISVSSQSPVLYPKRISRNCALGPTIADYHRLSRRLQLRHDRGGRLSIVLSIADRHSSFNSSFESADSALQTPELTPGGSPSIDASTKSFKSAVALVDDCHKLLLESIDGLPTVGVFSFADKDILSLKSVSLSTALVLHDCLHALKSLRKTTTIAQLPPSLRIYRSLK